MPTLEELRQTRIQKLENIKAEKKNPYPAQIKRDYIIKEVLDKFWLWRLTKKEFYLAGRIKTQRIHGRATFFDLEDNSEKIQCFLSPADLTDKKSYDKFLADYDIGDFVEVKGSVFKTKKGEKTIRLKEFRMISKSLRPLPEKWHGLKDVEERLRKRYLDLIMNSQEKDIFVKKSRFWQATREFLMKEGGLEVDTPVLEQIPGGADAEPFKTHMNALDIDLYLRISPELHLKRLIVAGFEKVFEIGRIFRNEGMDREHLQDYTQMEMYWAYNDYEKLMKLVERLIKYVIKETLGTLSHEYQGKNVNWSSKWKRYDYFDEFNKYTGLNLVDISENDLKKYAEKERIDTSLHIGKGRLIDVIFKKKVRPKLWEPGFLVLPPVDIEPLAKRWSVDLNRVERFQIVACGSELGKGFSELNDPLDQMARFEEQMKLRDAGDKEAQRMDKDFIEALEYGMPPAAGFAYSERLFSFIVDRSVRETVFFPLMRPYD